MCPLECADLQNTGTENSALQTDPPAGPKVLPLFSGKLSVDEKLKLRNETFKQTIDDFFKDKNITPLSQLTATPSFPTPHVLAQLASKTYKDTKNERLSLCMRHG
jgi:hypothetical protein